MTHTKEQLFISGDGTDVSYQRDRMDPIVAIAHCWERESGVDLPAGGNAARIVECVNACSGVTGADGTIPQGAFRKVVEATKDYLTRLHHGSQQQRQSSYEALVNLLRGLRLTDDPADQKETT